ncbi:class I SAM-dependent methyltransferase [Porphyromonas circumdentaria]|uniref:Methyltransferase domain-containing protein n=1 Tax=Porphyromonas circumdentaria TaxID=29524 RepID=A0A1T4N5N5_9PORP|nr:class I SAM-dependent methyltransferase [Porphyromonas circumdentaria]MBB6276042.1 SAM-dependent methyltransferase [Porphyromonas circumdentaria]MDO4722432.1 class I SAM-dependent methyltransferase [Porphyromonas circumdentaria]SJZ74441.1 Methyltransferase domain-containing protein [Porphyromonas circumdentaria]
MYCPICQKEGSQPIGVAKDYLVSHESFTLDQCPHCGFIRTADAPKGKQLGLYYKSADYISHSDTQRTFFDRLYHRARKRMLAVKRKLIERQLVSLGEKEPPIALLDIGCGTGYFARYMQEHGYHITGIEQDADARDFAQRNNGFSPYSSLLEAPLEEGSFDLITLWHVLEHIETLEEHLEKISRIIAPKGLLVVALPNPCSWDAHYYKEAWAAWDVPRHLWHFSPDNIRQLLQCYGFTQRAVRPMFLDVFYIALLSERQRGIPFLWAGVKAIFIGLVSFMKTLFSSREASSLIYFFTRK